MPRNIPIYPELLVISDTGMFYHNEVVYAFGPVVKELQALDSFKSIRWIGFNRPDQTNNKSYIRLEQDRIYTKAVKRTGGKRLMDKSLILFQYPIYLATIFKEIYRAEYVHVRAPSNPAVIAIFISFFFPKKIFWFKYAGDWVGKAAPFYKQQRNWLKRLNSNSKITVNGSWDNQPKNILSFENPCLDEEDRIEGKQSVDKKYISKTINYCFVGGLNENKGCLLLLQALKRMILPSSIDTFHIVGDGPLRQQLETMALELEIPVVFHGALPKDEVMRIYELCHYIVLPSQSEGFPKVIGEAMNYGCIPIVSNVSCIDQYVHHKKNGILIERISPEGISIALEDSFEISKHEYERVIHFNYKLASKFTYEYYNKRIANEIFRITV